MTNKQFGTTHFIEEDQLNGDERQSSEEGGDCSLEGRHGSSTGNGNWRDPNARKAGKEGEAAEIGEKDLRNVWEWNAAVPEAVEACVHDLITETARRQPEAAAVCAWDGNWTYRELDGVSTRLAHRLISLGIGPEVVVPLCFEKSRWTPVAMVAVMKAGGASVALDMTQPKERLRTIVQQVQPVVILSSSANRALAERLTHRPTAMVVLDEAYLAQLGDCKWKQLPAVLPWTTIYVVFTSGSTGTPKGVIITHSNISSAIKHQRHILGFDAKSRVYDFASYMFDVVWCDTLQGLSAGSCLCIPSDQERKSDFIGGVARLSANTAIFTPSTTRGLDQRPLQGLRNLHFIGEPLYTDCIKDIARELTVSNLYGPTECTTLSTVQTVMKEDSGRVSIGKGVGANTWVVRPSDHNYLAAVGSVGELLLEGPLVGAGYLGDAEKTAAAFIEDPLWLLRGAPDRPGRRGRLYKTGDLVRYNADGSLIFIGRKDAQVKINGQRIELGDVEHHMRMNVADGAEIQLVAEAVTPRESDRTVLIAFLRIIDSTATGKNALLAEMKRITAGLDDRLAAHLPAYMIPTAYIAINEIPMTATGKMDRPRLRAMGEAMTLQQLAATNPSRAQRRAPTTDKEKHLQSLWSRVLGINADSIGLDDSFLRIGGDSIGAMRLVAAAREEGLSLTVAEVFRQPTLVDLAPAACQLGNGDVEDLVPPLSLLDEEHRTQATYEAVASLCGIDASQVEDVFPCTPMQEGLLAMTARRAGDYVSRQEFLLRQDVDPGRLKQAMRATIAAMPILRTRVVDLPGQGLVQVVTTTEAAAGEDDAGEMKLGARLQACRIEREAQVWQDGREENSRWLFTWTLHHALYDGWSTPILYQAISDAYHNVPVASATPFQRFIKHVGSTPRDDVVAYWESQLAGSEAVVFPALPSISHQPQADKSIAHAISDIRWRDDNITPSTIIRAAWAIVSAQYTNSSEAVFGATVSGRQVPVVGIERMAGPTIATVPVVVKLDHSGTVGDMLQQVQGQATEMITYEQTGLQAIRRMSREVAQGSEFQTLLVVQPAEDTAGQNKAAELLYPEKTTAEDEEDRVARVDLFTNYALSVIATNRGDEVQIRLSYDSSVISGERVSRLALQLQHVLAQLCAAAYTAPVASVLDAVSDTDMDDIWRWNAAVPNTVDRCVHDMITETMRRQPDAPAVCAWDGDFTYGELDDLSMRLAWHLVGVGVKRGDIVPLCFEKSKWTTVAIMGVMRAGAASVLLDATLPEERLKSIARQTTANMILTSKTSRDLAGRLGDNRVFVVSPDTLSKLNRAAAELPTVRPSDTLYVVFTSGSTGTPKGAIVSHDNIASAFHHQQSALGMDPHSRVYDFVSYAFDVAWLNVLHVLHAGGCICVPRESDRKEDVEASIRKLAVNYTHITPSVARLLDPKKIDAMLTINLIGEAVAETDMVQWKGVTKVLITYGPAECTISSTVGFGRTCDSAGAPAIGTGLGLNTWVVSPSEHNVLVPFGCTGELLLEGPLVGQGYLNDPRKTAAAFIEDPAWLLRGGPGVPGRKGRLYKTGDLVYYNPDGTLQFVGRKDSQVKINGQRVELGEIEHHVQRCLAVEGAAAEANRGRPGVVVEAVVPAGGEKKVLAAFVAVEDEADGNATAAIGRLCRGIENRLAESVPAYMIPTAYIAINEILITATGKMDRRRLRAMGEAMTLQQLAATNPSRAERRRAPTTEKEKHLQRLWARVLGVDADSIGLDDSFLRIGGDSIGAMRLVAAAREEGLLLTAADVFQLPRLVDLASGACLPDDGEAEEPIVPLSLLGEEHRTQATYDAVASRCGIEASQVEDVFPCTPMQEGLLAMTARRAGDYVSRQEFLLRQDVDPGRLKQAMRATIAAMPILRTRVVDLPGQGLVQVVTTTEAAAGEDDAGEMKLGARLQACRIEREAQVWQDGREENSRWLFTWTLHHALYDGWSTPILYQAISDAYHNVPVASATPFQRFIKHVGSAPRDDVVAYWESQLAGSEAVVFPALPSISHQPQADKSIAHAISDIRWRGDDVTTSTIIRAAWAIMSAQYTNSSEAVFGATVSGRQAPVAGIERMAGPTIATVPVVVKLDHRATVGDLLRQVQDQATEMVAYEQTGLQAIRRMSGEVARGSEFQTLVVIQPTEDMAGQNNAAELFDQKEAAAVDDKVEVRGLDAFTNYALSVLATPRGAQLEVRLSYDSSVISGERVSRLALQLQHVLAQLCTAASTAPVASVLDTVSDADIDDIWRWNAAVPETVERCIHDIIGETMRRQPNAPAICAWDGDFTYRELDELAMRLARHLVWLGVKRGDIVPLCFEKSKWTTVAIMGVMRAGAASVLLDTTLPEERLRTIVRQVSARTMLSAAANAPLAGQLKSEAAIVIVDTVSSLLPACIDEVASAPQLPNVSPFDRLYVVYTSGSTGKPKGVVISHANVCSALRHQRDELRFTASSRVFDSASYAFDAAWGILFFTLFAGGCLCVPSEDDRRNDVTTAMISLRVSYAAITPSFADTIRVEDICSLQQAVFSGETLSVDTLGRWRALKCLLNVYGPAECTITATMSLISPNAGSSSSIGRGIGQNTWIVDAANHQSLLPVGSVGELLLEGPLVGQGYLNDPEKTAAAFIDDPAWLVRGGPGVPGRKGRLYKTGDLVYYDPDGTLQFVGRKDSQVKINGQRVELGEIEHHVQRCLAVEGGGSKEKRASGKVDGSRSGVVVEAVMPAGGDKKVLVAFVAVGEEVALDGGNAAVVIQGLCGGIEDRLALSLPAYMIPPAYIAIHGIPMTATGKTDRPRLRAMGEAMTLQQLAATNPSRAQRRAPTTDKEKHLQSLWSRVLGINADSIGLGDSFLRIGGDSIGAMRLVAAAREEGLSLTVAEVFRQPTLVDLASAACLLTDGDAEDLVLPLSLLGEEYRTQATYAIAAQLCGIDTSQVEDVFPCTPIQEGLLAMTARRAGDYVSRQEFLLRQEVNPERFDQAMRATIAAVPTLRSRVVDLPGQGLVQVVTTTDAAVGEDDAGEIKLGTRLSTYHIREQQAAAGGDSPSRRCFVWTLHHALYDGWSIPILYQALSEAYHNMQVMSPTPFQRFIKYVGSVQRDDVVAFWKSQLAGSDAVVFPALRSISYQPQANKSIEDVISDMRWRGDGVTPSTIVRAAWAIVSAQYTNSSEAVFGATVSGRQAPVAGIERMAGPTIATVPVVVKLDHRATVGDLLRQVQDQATEMVAYEQTGLQAIRRMSGEVARGSQFQTLLVVQLAEDMAGQDKAAELFEQKEATTETDEGGIGRADAFTNYALSVIVTLARNGVKVRLSYDSSVIVGGRVSRLALQLRHVLAQLCAAASTATVASVLDAVSDADMEDIWKWNATVPETVERCVHDMIGETMRRQPNAPAICAWDGDFTYRELDELAMRLARHLVWLGVKRGDIVPLCFEKSKWTTVAIMGVMRAGAASVLLDATLPEERLRTVMRQTNAATLVSCCLCQPVSSQLGGNVVLVDSITTQWLDESATVLPVCLPVDTLYIVFTSGSTGLPKGAVISHANFATAFHHQQSRLAITGRSRVYDSASYAFDASWFNVLHTLFAGGCLCVPRNNDRTERIEASIKALRADYAQFTPSVARMVNLIGSEQLETITLAGEPVMERDMEQWKERANVIIAYGPSECSAASTIDSSPKYRASSRNDNAAPIGAGAGLNCWVVEREDQHVLMPLGCVGELLLEGPLVGQGYLNDPEKTAAAFIDDPTWLVRGGPGVPGRRGRLYKTGDLVYYNPDGTLQFVGRKDAQVKINGQRVELGEIEHHVQRCLSIEEGAAADADKKRPSVVVEAVMPAGGDKKVLVAFVAVGDEAASGGSKSTAIIQGLCGGIENRLAVSLPAYMIPTAYIATNRIPMTATGKMDRRWLRAMGEAMTLEQLAATNPSRAERRAPTTEKERHLQRLWARVLGVDADSIGLDDSFLRIGGDSIGAMRLVAAAREEGLSLTVAEVFRQPTLEDLASNISHSDYTSVHSYTPLSMVSASFGRDGLLSAAQFVVQKLHGSADALIEDVFPITEFQEHCLKQPTSRCYHFYADIPFTFNTQYFVELFTSVFQSIDCLRSVFLHYKGLYFQAVLQGLLTPITVVNAEEDDINDASDKVALNSHHTITGLGGFFTHFFIIRGDGLTRLVLRVSHAQYDGVSLQLLASKLDEAFRHGTKQVQPQPAFSSYLYQAILVKDEALRYWRNMLLQSRPTKLAAVSSRTLEQTCTSRRAKSSHRIPAPCCPVGVTPASLFTTACAHAISQISASDDVLLGLLVTGRSALHPSLHDVFGPCINIIPVKYQDSQTNDFAESCHQIQAQCAKSRSHEMAQFRDVTQMYSSSEALNFGAVIQFQDVNESSWITTRGSSLSFKPMKLATIQDDCFPEETLFVSAEPFEGYWNVCVSGDGRQYDDFFVQLALKSIIDIIHQATLRADA